MPTIARHRYLATLVVFLGPICHTHAGDVNNGAAVYYDHGCYSCHGYNGTGRTPLANGVSGIMANEDVFISFLRQRADRNPILPDNSMPNFGVDALSDEQAKDVYAYIKTLKDDPPEVNEIPSFVKMLDAAKAKGPENEE
jgi:mono/diheme cytochrome c family protein